MNIANRMKNFISDLMIAIHSVIKNDNQVGFVLFVFDLKTNTSQFVSNGDRQQMLSAVQEKIEQVKNEPVNPESNPFHANSLN